MYHIHAEKSSGRTLSIFGNAWGDPPQDYQFFYDQGVVGIFGPGTVLPLATQQVLSVIREQISAPVPA